jgi:hypothetical protein
LSEDSRAHQINGTWHKNAFHLNSPRTRTTFLGYRSTRKVNGQYQTALASSQRLIVWPKTQWDWKSLEIDFLGFNKVEYYAKSDDIEKERWVGMSLSRNLKHLKSSKNQTIEIESSSSDFSTFEDYLFVNGNIHPIKSIDFSIPLDIGQSDQ